nr:crosslink repair DNA glycosylase YcaQ family protein [Nocardioides convexus]
MRLDDGLPRSKDHWGWNWSRTRRVLDYLFTVGDLAIAGRNSQFEIRYDLPERVLPARYVDAPALPAAEAHVEPGPPCRPFPRGRECAVPGRLLPAQGGRGPARDRRAGRGG